MGSGIFVTVEGGEGVGKSTFVKGLCQRLIDEGISPLRTFEPGGTPVAMQIRKVFTDPAEDEALAGCTELFLMSAARAQHVIHIIKPALERGSWVVCDRFADSTRVYQGYVAGVSDSFLEQVIQQSTFSLEPDVTLLLDCEVDTILARIAERGASSRLDIKGREFHEKLRAGFLQLAKKFANRFIILDASQPSDRVVGQAVEVLRKRAIL